MNLEKNKYEPSEKRRLLAIKYLTELSKEETRLRTMLDKYDLNKVVPKLASENDEQSLRHAHDVFTKMSIILEDYLYLYEWETDIQERVCRAKIKYRLAIVEKYLPEERLQISDELKTRERIAKKAHREYLCDIREP